MVAKIVVPLKAPIQLLSTTVAMLLYSLESVELGPTRQVDRISAKVGDKMGDEIDETAS